MAQPDRTQGNVPSFPTILLLAGWFGIWTGIAVVAAHLVGLVLSSHVVFVDPQLVWTSPAANVLVFVGTALALGLAALAVPVLRSMKVVLGTFLTLAGYSMALLYPRINLWALLLLSIGVGAQMGKVLAPRLDRFMPLIRRSTVGGAILVVVAAGVINTRLILGQNDATARVAAADPDSPNVLLVILDTVRSISMGLYGYDRPTSPFIDSFAARGVTFDYAFAPSSWTLASHGTLFTGRLPFDLEVSWLSALSDRHPVIAEVLRDRGYATSGYVANFRFGPSVYGLGRGFDHYSGWPHNIGNSLRTAPLIRRGMTLYNEAFNEHYIAQRRTAGEIVNEFQAWRQDVVGRPWFAFLNLFDAHEPYDPPPPWDTRFGNPVHRRLTWEPSDPTVVGDLTDAYDGGIAYMDSVLSVLIGSLEADGSLDNTLVVITSDHGEHLGERGLLDHGNSLYAPLLHVPLIFVWPRRLPAGRRIAHAVSLRDVPTTIEKLTSPSGATSTTLPGRPLNRLWTRQTPPAAPDTIYAGLEFAPRQPEWYPLSKGSMRSVIVWPYHYILNGDGAEELFDLSRDIGETGPSLDEPETLARMRDALATFPERLTLAPQSGSR